MAPGRVIPKSGETRIAGFTVSLENRADLELIPKPGPLLDPMLKASRLRYRSVTSSTKGSRLA